ncbi:MAG: hypothetical protein U0792_21050 [Gemmataceae bacterium]
MSNTHAATGLSGSTSTNGTPARRARVAFVFLAIADARDHAVFAGQSRVLLLLVLA